ncbi:hypothetical protein MRX96_024620 [Rhipicephalus microplus]
MSTAGNVAPGGPGRGRGRGRGRLRLNQPIPTPGSSSWEANDAKPPVAVVGRSAPCTSASSMPACSYAYNKLPHKHSVLENEGRNGPAMTPAVLNKRHADPAIKQPGVPKYNRWDEPSVSTSGQPYLTTHGKGTPRHVSHLEADQRQCKPAAESFRNDFCSRQTDSTNAGSSSIHQHRTIPGRPSKPSPGVKPSLSYSSKARHDRPAAATVTTGIDHQYALNLHKRCPSLPPVEDIAKRLKDLQRRFQSTGLRVDMSCSMTDTEPCWISNSLTMFNRIFSETNIEVKEEEPRKFSVCFLDGIERSDHNRTFNACILLHILLTRHKCVKSLLLDKRTIANRFPEILCDALACNRGLKHLAIDCWDISPGYEHTLVSSFCKMPARIETIAVSNLSMGPSEAARIGEMVAKTESVRIIKFLDNGMPPGAGTELMKGVCRNGSLELIWLRGNAIGFGGARILGEYLSTSLKLRDLSLSHVPCFDEGQLVLIAEGLKTNRSLETLKIEYCHVTPTGIDTLAEVLKTNSTLKNLAVSACGLAQTAARSLGILLEFNSALLDVDLKDNIIDDTGAMRLATSLRINTHLETLNLEANHISSVGVLTLVEALASNKVLKELRLGSFPAQNADNEQAVRTALSSTVAHGRVQLCYKRLSYVFDLSEGLHLNAKRITSIHLTASVNIKGDCLKKLFGSLAQLSCLESLCLESPIRMDDSAARKFARLLVTTKTLKRIQINDCNAKKGALEIVMEGLKVNQSVSHMEMEFSATRSSWTNAFVNMLKGNKTLTHFGHITTKKSELHYIAEELHANHFLTSLNIWEQPGYEEDIFAINEILRRNAAHLNRAVEFALDPEKYGVEREPAEGYEELCDTQTFQNHLSRVVGPERASEAMRNARRHITTNLFAIAGVCQGPVTCWPHPKGAPQADSLNIWCWMDIFSYLKLADIPRTSPDSVTS